MNFNLLLAVVWLAVGVLLLVWQWYDPNAPSRSILNTGISWGWLALLLALYNLVRWWAGRSAAAERRLEAEARARYHREHHPRPVQEPDPTFDFSKPPPPPEGEGRDPG